MKRNKLAALGLSAALAASLAVPALAADNGLLISPNPNAYPHAITVNGEALDTLGLPNVDGLPIRLVAEADHGSASWFAEENSAGMNLSAGYFTIDFSDGSVSQRDEKVEGVTATVVDGVTFLPVSFFQSLDGFTVTVDEASGAVDVVTPNNDPMVKLLYTLAETGEVFGMKHDATSLENFGFTADCFQDGQACGFSGFNTTPNSIFLIKVADGKLDAVKETAEAYRQAQEDTFSWYLSHNLPKVQDARFETEGDYFLFFIGENADAAVEQFHAAAKEL